jgi:hypothetical protein
MRTAILALCLGSAAAFAPAARVATRVAPVAAFEEELGAQPPLGFFDPLGLLENADQARFDRLRGVELKHGRISMLAVLGHITTTGGVHFPGAVDLSGLKFSEVPNGLAAFGVLPAAGIAQIFAFIAFLEVGVMKDVTGLAEFPGDFRNGFAGASWDNLDEETKLSKRAIELNNGRAAQMGILALMVHEKLNNDPYIINSLLGSPVPFNA